VCKGRLRPGEKPLCVNTCEDASIDYREVNTEKESNIVEVFEDIVVKVAGGQLWEPFLREVEKAKK
jgi:Fe-S-cluster-containing dehydrogenase component